MESRRLFVLELLEIRIKTTLLAVIVLIIMLVQKSNSLRVAVLGSGISGSAAARKLAENGMDVTVFEVGFGIGGRTSTRITRDGNRYQFDHGAQYISSPKTDAFKAHFDRWVSDGWVKEWSGKFVTVDDTKINIDDGKKKKWVGYPCMNSICRNLLHHDKIKVKLQTRANAELKKNGSSGWNLKDDKSQKDLGTFDWIIVSDRNSGAHYRRDLASADVEEFRSSIRKIQSVRSLTAMVVFEEPLNINIDGAQFTGKDTTQYGMLGWVARDTSKPGRERKDGKECWVLQSHPDPTEELFKKENFKIHERGKVKEMARNILVNDFLKSLQHLRRHDDNDNSSLVNTPSPKISYSVGHRWGSAFPISPKAFTRVDSQIISKSRQIVTCGDYYGSFSGRIEGAFLSGESAASRIIQIINEDDCQAYPNDELTSNSLEI